MDGNELKVTLKSFGLKITKSGSVRDILCVYCIVTDNGVIMRPDGKSFDFNSSDIVRMKYDSKNRQIVMTLIDDSQAVILGEYEYDESGNIMLNPGKMPKSLFELDDIMPALFPGIESALFYDVLEEQGMVDPSLFGMPVDIDVNYVPVDDDVFPFYHDAVQRRLSEYGFTGSFPTVTVMDEVLKKRILQNKRNLFLEWVSEVEWDGKPRARTWFIEGLGATAPALSPEQEKIYLEEATLAWFMGGIQRMFKEQKVEIVPVLIGGEGMGKGNYLLYTVGGQEHANWFMDTTQSLEGAGAEEKMLETIRGAILVELSEATQFSTVKGAELLKSFVSKSKDKHRKAYAREAKISYRRFLLVATSNRNNVFLDVGGGNRRYFPMYCDPNRATRAFDPKNNSINSEDARQVWAEVLHYYREDPNVNSYLTKEVAELAAVMQDYGTIEDSNVNMIDEWLDSDKNGFDEVGAKITKEEIFYRILGVSLNGAGVVPLYADQIYTKWADKQKCWRKLSAYALKRLGKSSRHVYERIYSPEDVKIKRRANMVDVAPGQEASFVDVVGITRRCAMASGAKCFGDVMETGMLTSEEVQVILDAGYIYYDDNTGKYLLTELP